MTCEPVTCELYPEVESTDLAHSVRAGPNDRNGSQRLCSFAAENKANAALSQLPARWQGFVARGLNSLEPGRYPT